MKIDLSGKLAIVSGSTDADVAEVAHLVTYIASPLSSATTGAALRVDGGVVDSLTI
jgi:enoyl-[acyl-carrier-protein] reductase (NADH)